MASGKMEDESIASFRDRKNKFSVIIEFIWDGNWIFDDDHHK